MDTRKAAAKITPLEILIRPIIVYSSPIKDRIIRVSIEGSTIIIGTKEDQKHIDLLIKRNRDRLQSDTTSDITMLLKRLFKLLESPKLEPVLLSTISANGR